MGNSCGAMHKYTEYAYEEPLYQGGFIWDFIDQSIRTRDRYGRTDYAYGGDFGDRPTDYNFCGNGIVYGDGTESPKMQEVRYNYQNIVAQVQADRAVITNRSMFTSTAAYRCVALLARDGVQIAQAELETAKRRRSGTRRCASCGASATPACTASTSRRCSATWRAGWCPTAGAGAR